MLFISFEFILFLPVVFLLYWYALGRSLKWQNLLVVVSSYIFYGWWDARFLFFIALTSFFSWWSGLKISKAKTNGEAKIWMWNNIILNLGILFVFKYYNFFIDSLAYSCEAFGITLSVPTLRIILPVGVSFYTFQALSYSIDIYRKIITQTKDVVAFFAYVCFFPQLVAGPIERATNLLPQFLSPRKFDYALACDGCRQMLWGFFKKVAVADLCGRYVDANWGNYSYYPPSLIALCVVLFAFQIYADFSGYSDIAIGCAKLFGIRLKANFRLPYFSRDIAEFWRRWHISLTTWFRDYIYIPLGGSRTTQIKVIRNTLIIFLVSGLWHGASWTFVFWGLFHGLLFLPLIITKKNRKYLNNDQEPWYKLPSIKMLVQMLFTFLLVTIGWIWFRAISLSEALLILEKLCSWKSFGVVWRFFTYTETFHQCSMIMLLLIVEWFTRHKEHPFQQSLPWWIMYPVYLVFVLILIAYMGENPQFIYFQF